MEKIKKTDEKGNSHSTNWMLDDIIELFEKRGMNNGENDDLIKELFIQKIEYGRLCIIELLSFGAGDLNRFHDCFKNIDLALKNKIAEVDGSPKDVDYQNLLNKLKENNYKKEGEQKT